MCSLFFSDSFVFLWTFASRAHHDDQEEREGEGVDVVPHVGVVGPEEDGHHQGNVHQQQGSDALGGPARVQGSGFRVLGMGVGFIVYDLGLIAPCS